MFSKNEVHFDGDYFFKSQALATGTDAQVSDAFELGNPHGGLRIHGWLDGTATAGSGNTIIATLQGADTEDATSWTDIASNTATVDATVTGTGTDATTAYSVSGDILNYIPEGGYKFMRVSVANSTGMTGTFSVAPEYIPR